jgi:hypothetical protein
MRRAERCQGAWRLTTDPTDATAAPEKYASAMSDLETAAPSRASTLSSPAPSGSPRRSPAGNAGRAADAARTPDGRRRRLGRGDAVLALQGKAAGVAVVAAGGRIIQHEARRRAVPGEEARRIAARIEVALGQQPARIGAHEVRPVAPVADEITVVPDASIITFARPSASAPSVPGRSRSHWSALPARPTRRGSTTISRIPRLSARRSLLPSAAGTSITSNWMRERDATRRIRRSPHVAMPFALGSGNR